MLAEAVGVRVTGRLARPWRAAWVVDELDARSVVSASVAREASAAPARSAGSRQGLRSGRLGALNAPLGLLTTAVCPAILVMVDLLPGPLFVRSVGRREHSNGCGLLGQQPPPLLYLSSRFLSAIASLRW